MVKFPCTFKRTACLLLTVTLGLCAAAVHATKIEFSVPANEVEIPDLQKEIKQEAKTPSKSDMNFKGGALDVAPMAPIIVTGSQERDIFAKEKEKARDSQKNGKTLTADEQVAEQIKAAKAIEVMRSETDNNLSGSAWQNDRRGMSRDAERESDGGYNPRERSIGWSTLFKDQRDERDRKQQEARLNEFRALYETQSSVSPIGTPPPNSDPFKQSLWQQPGAGMRDGRADLMSRRDDANYIQVTPGSRGTGETFNQQPVRSDSQRREIAPFRNFDEHRGVLEMPKRPGDLLR